MARARTLTLKTKVEVTGADKLRSLGDKLQGVGTALSVGVTAPLTVLGATAVNAASELQQSTGAIESVFGEAGEAVERFSKTAADSFGLSERQVKEFGSLLGAQLQSFGFEADEAAKMAIELQQRAADMAATFGGTVPDAVAAISSLMRGERNPIERYGVALKQADINARIMAKGLDTSTTEAQKQAEAIAGLELLYEQTAKTQGQFGRESDTLAGQQARLSAKWENMQATIGQKLLPAMVTITEVIAGVVDAFNALPTEVQGGIVAFGIFAAALGPLLFTLGSLAKAVGAVNTAFRTLFVAEQGRQVGRLASAFSGLTSAVSGAASTIATTLTSAISGAAAAARGAVTAVATTLGSAFSAAFTAAVTIARGLAAVIMGGLSAAGGAVRAAVTAAGAALGSLFGAAFSAASGVVSPVIDAIAGIGRAAAGRVVAAGAALGGLFGSAFSTAMSVGETIVGALATGLRAARGRLTRVATALGAVFGAIFAQAVDVAGFVTDWVNGLFKLALDDVRNKGGFLGTIFGAAFSAGASAAEAITNFLTGLLAAGRRRIQAIALTLAIEFGAGFTRAAALLAPAAIQIGALFHLMLGPIGLVTAAISALAAAFMTDFLGIRSAITGFVDDMALNFGEMGDTVHRLADEAGVDFQTMKDRIKDAMAETGDSFEDVTDRIDSGLSGMKVTARVRFKAFNDEVHRHLMLAKSGVENATREGIVDPMLEELLGGMEEAEKIAGQTPDAIITAILSRQFDVKRAWETLREVQEQALHPMIERAQIIAFLSSDAVKRGVNDGTPAVAEAYRVMVAEAERRLRELEQSSYFFGLETAGSYASGLRAGFGWVRDAAGNLAAATRNQIGINSEPRDPNSPLRGITKWGANLAQTYADGMRRGQQAIASAATALAGAAQLPSGGFGAFSPSFASAAPAASGGDTHFHFVINGDVVPGTEERITQSLLRGWNLVQAVR